MQRVTLFLWAIGPSLIVPTLTYGTVSYGATLSSPTVYLPESTTSNPSASNTHSGNSNSSDLSNLLVSLNSFFPAINSIGSVLSGNLPFSLSLNTGALGLPDLALYRSQVNNLYGQIPISTTFGNGTLFRDLLSNIQPTDSGLLFDIAIDGSIIYSNNNGTIEETVVSPEQLSDRYWRLAFGEFATQTGEEFGLSSLSQAAIQNILDLSAISNANSQTEVNNSLAESLDSGIRANTLTTHTNSIASLATTSRAIANSSFLTDTSFQILRNISQQMGLLAEQNSSQAAQNQQLGQILANSSQQLTQQSQQFKEQQNTATHLLETSKQQQILEAIQTTAQGQQLQILTKAQTEQNRLDNAAFRHAQQGAGMIVIPTAPNVD